MSSSHKCGLIKLEIPNLDLVDVPAIFGKVEAFVQSLKNEGYSSKLDTFHINAEMDHYEGIIDEEDDDEDEDEIVN